MGLFAVLILWQRYGSSVPICFILQGKDEFLGRARAEPVVRCNGSEGAPARLAWYTIEKDGGYGGDILAAFELFLVSLILQIKNILIS